MELITGLIAPNQDVIKAPGHVHTQNLVPNRREVAAPSRMPPKPKCPSLRLRTAMKMKMKMTAKCRPSELEPGRALQIMSRVPLHLAVTLDIRMRLRGKCPPKAISNLCHQSSGQIQSLELAIHRQPMDQAHNHPLTLSPGVLVIWDTIPLTRASHRRRFHYLISHTCSAFTSTIYGTT